MTACRQVRGRFVSWRPAQNPNLGGRRHGLQSCQGWRSRPLDIPQQAQSRGLFHSPTPHHRAGSMAGGLRRRPARRGQGSRHPPCPLGALPPRPGRRRPHRPARRWAAHSRGRRPAVPAQHVRPASAVRARKRWLHHRSGDRAVHRNADRQAGHRAGLFVRQGCHLRPRAERLPGCDQHRQAGAGTAFRKLSRGPAGRDCERKAGAHCYMRAGHRPVHIWLATITSLRSAKDRGAS